HATIIATSISRIISFPPCYSSLAGRIPLHHLPDSTSTLRLKHFVNDKNWDISLTRDNHETEVLFEGRQQRPSILTAADSAITGHPPRRRAVAIGSPRNFKAIAPLQSCHIDDRAPKHTLQLSHDS